MMMPIKDITDTLASISSYYKSHVGIDLDMEMSIDNDDVMAIDCAIKALEELKEHREAWEKCIKEIKEWYWNADKQAIASRDHQLKALATDNIMNKIKSIVAEWKSDIWTDNVSYECMIKIAEIVDKAERRDKE